MKKLGKFIFGTVALASIAAGAYYIYKKFIKKDSSDDFDDFEDDFEDFDEEEDTADNDSREYVTINITGEDIASSKAEDTDEDTSLSEDEQ